MRLFKKKADDNGASTEDPNRAALFGNKSKGQSDNPYAQQPSGNPYAQAPQSGNPYAQGPQASNPYDSPQPTANPYDNARSGAYTQARQNAYGADQDSQGRPSGDHKKNPYSSEEKGDNKYSGYSSNRYGASGGYGNNRYGTEDNKSQTTSRYGAGGYGGFEGRDPYAKQDDPNRNALFSGAAERAAQNKLNEGAAPPPYDSGSAAGDYRGGSSGYGSSGNYNPGPKYDDRQLTAEEEEEESINATKQEIRAIKQKDVSATRNALRMGQQAEEVGRDTLARLGVQAEYIHNTERNLDLANNQNKMAEDKARELKTLNRSMFAVHVANPFTAKSRDASRDAAVRERHEDERAQREATRREQFLAHQRMEKNFNELSQGQQNKEEQRQKNLAERSKYQFEADSEDEEMENEIDSNLYALGGVVNNMRRIAIATGEEVDDQNRRLQSVHAKVCARMIKKKEKLTADRAIKSMWALLAIQLN